MVHLVFLSMLLSAEPAWQPGPPVQWREKIVYYDPLYDSAHIRNPQRLAEYLAANGFRHLGARQLGSWMTGAIDKGPYGTLVVMTMGVAPASVLRPEEAQNSPLLRYLRAGGRVLWLGDVPLAYFQDETSPALGGMENGLSLVGLRGDWGLPIWGNRDKRVEVSQQGRRWGLAHPNGSIIATYADDVTAALSSFYSEDAKARAAVDYFKNLAPQFPWSGLIFALRGVDLANPVFAQEAYRIALYCGQPIDAPEVRRAPEVRPPYEISFTLADPHNRTCYLRGETIPLAIELAASAGLARPSHLALALEKDGRTEAERTFPSGQLPGRYPWPIETADLACGDYAVRARLLAGKKLLAEGRQGLAICPRRADPTFFFSAWSPNPANPYRCRMLLEAFARHGLQLGTADRSTNPILLDECLKYGLRFSLRIHGDARGPFELGSQRLAPGGEHVPSAWGGGRPMESLASPILRSQVAESFAKELSGVLGYPALWPFCHTNDDFSVRYGLDYSDMARRLFREQTGLEPPVPAEIKKLGPRLGGTYVMNRPAGVIPENDPWLRWWTFTTRDLGGGYNRAITEAARKVLPEIRLGPVPGGMQWPLWCPGQYPPHQFGPAGFNCLWYYYYLNYWQPLVGALYWDEVARMANRGLPLYVTAGLYGTNEPTYYRNKFFLHLAGGVQGFNYFTYRDGEQRPRGLAEIGRLGTGLVHDYDPLLGRLRPRRHQVGLLLPYTHSIHDTGYSITALYAYANLLAAHVDVEPTCEEELIAEGGKPYRVIVLYGVRWLRAKAHEALVEFVRRGGTVLVDAGTALEIPGAKRLDVDLALGSPPSGQKSPGRPGIHDYAIAERIAQIRQALLPYASPEVDVDSPDYLLREAQADGLRYLWIVHVHSHEDYEYLRPRIGAGAKPADPKRAAQEAVAWLDAKDRAGGGRRSATVTVPPGYAVYDVLAGRRIPVKLERNRARFQADTQFLGGQLLALYPRPIGRVPVEAPRLARAVPASIRISVLDDHETPMPGSHPIRLTMSHDGKPFSEWTGSYLTDKGRLEVPIRPARNHPPGPWQVEVRELSSGLRKTATVEVN